MDVQGGNCTGIDLSLLLLDPSDNRGRIRGYPADGTDVVVGYLLPVDDRGSVSDCQIPDAMCLREPQA